MPVKSSLPTNIKRSGPQVQVMSPPQASAGGFRRGIPSLATSAPLGNTSPAAAYAGINYAGLQSNQNTNPYLHFTPPANAGSYPDVEVLYSPNNTLPPRRETGIIEKLLQNFGFVQCCDRQARLFFHFSQYAGNIDDLKNGDEVEFEAGLDRRTGKPIALNILKHARIPSEIISDKRYVGEVTYAPKHNTIIKPGSSPQTELGRLSYENKGEWYFLSFTPVDVSGDLTALKQGDKVSFRIATDQRTNSMKARDVRLEESAAAPRHQGVVCSLKDNFGFIERADCVKEIFFHFSEFMGEVSNVNVGDDVEFEIHTRNGKEVATSVYALPAGTVQFEDVRPEMRRGTIVKPIPRAPGKKPNPDDPLPARLKYKDEIEGECEIVFGERDQNGEYTLLAGDQVTFNLAIDKRDSLKRATNVTLLEESLRTSGEKRERGTIATLKDGFGFVNCFDKGSRLFFHFSEVLDQKGYIKLNCEVEFSIITTDSPDKQNAVRIKIIGPGNQKKTNRSNSATSQQSNSAVGKGSLANSPLLLHSNASQLSSASPLTAQSPITVATLADGETVTKTRGFVSCILRNHGYIESEDHKREYHFQTSAVMLPQDSTLEVGDEVQFLLRTTGEKSIADNVSVLERKTIQSMTVDPETLTGEVVRAIRSSNEDPQGLVKEKIQDLFTGRQFRFSASSFTFRPLPVLQAGDLVEFRVGTVVKTGEKRAVEVKPTRSRLRSKVTAVKGEFGFIAHASEGANENKQLFFHQSEVADYVRLKPGDEVEYEVVKNPKTNKSAAANVKRISTAAAPADKSTDRLSHRVRTISLSRNDSKVSIIREPYVSDGSKGFQFQRSVPASVGDSVRKDTLDEEDDDLFASNEDDLCAEDGSGDNYHQDESEVKSNSIRITSAPSVITSVDNMNNASATSADIATNKVDSCGDA
ncbi:cold shock domain-containing protein E1-like isoform X3 [Convolutriloba macropyga]|uniref:cold shock domain-containing protein E1-like isoform X3 n=1 Tax=Convolutriloba macropyga TaxID=536237 RepID=UPI003F51D2E9